VAEALERIGIEPNRILLLCSYEPDVNSLCAPDAARRWSRYKTFAAGLTRRLPHDAGAYLGGGEWRSHFLWPQQPWPAAWTQMERLKYRSDDAGSLLKFEGHGHYGEAVRLRQQALDYAGFGPHYLGHEQGFGRIGIQAGQLGSKLRLSRSLLLQMAEYCAWRASACSVPEADAGALANMAAENIRAAFGTEFPLDLPVERPVVADSRMQPHKWLRTRDARWLKLDGATHGDDHFFPGPCDIAWDLAGVCVEWALPDEARTLLVDEYTRHTGDRIASRLPAYQLAYTAFRMAWTGMAASSMAGTPDAPRLAAEHNLYRAALEQQLADRSLSGAAEPRPARSA
jgi:hypothetical protein